MVKHTNMPKINIAARRSYCIYRRGVKKQKIKQHKTAQGFGSLGIFMVVLVIFFGIIYLFSVNDIATKGDEIYTVEQSIQNLTRQNEQLIIQEAQLRSLENVEDVIKDKEMQEIKEPTYINREFFVALD